MVLEMIGFAVAAALILKPNDRKADTQTAAPSDAARKEQYRHRLDLAIGLESEEQLAREARGRIAKERLLKSIRRDIPSHRALVPTGQPARVRYTGPMPRGRANVRQMALPLRSIRRRSRAA
jgi:hypothetical protein